MSKKFYFIQLILLILCAGLLIHDLPIAGGLDRSLILSYIDLQHGFFLKNDWWYDRFAHQYLKIFQDFIVIYILVGIVLYKFKSGFLSAKDYSAYRTLLLLLLISMFFISILKHLSSHSCPWSMLNISQQQIHFLAFLGNGGCFPGGHASLGYAWIAGFFAFYRIDRQRAYFYLITGLILGTAMGWTQMMRGAHFLSHNLWTLWITYTIDLIIYSGFNLFSYYAMIFVAKFYVKQAQ